MTERDSRYDHCRAALEDGVWTTGPDGELIPDYESTFPTINEGEVVHGTVVRVDKDEVLVDIGYKSEGVIPVAELSIRRSVNPADEVSVGDEIDALVMTKEDAEGPPDPLEEARPLRARLEGDRAGRRERRARHRPRDRGRQGRPDPRPRRARLPAGVARRHPPRPGPRRVPRPGAPLQGDRAQPLAQQRRALAPRRARGRAQGDAPGDPRPAQPGRRRRRPISNIVDFGAFVDLDGMDGLIHISELSWSHVNHPSEVLEIGQKVKVKVLDIDRDRQRISLGLKQTQTDPWQQVLESYNEGDIVEGRVTKVVTFGAFVEILPGVEGLVHISELAQHHVENPREVVSQGDTVNVRILEVDAERRRLSLSLKRVDEGEPPQPRAGGRVGTAPRSTSPEDVFGRRGARRRDRRASCRTRRDVPSGRAAERRRAERRVPCTTDDEPDDEAAPTSPTPERRRRRSLRARPRVACRDRVAVALTGGIGAGKSEALKAFARHGAATVSERRDRPRAAGARPGGARVDPRALGRRRGRRPVARIGEDRLRRPGELEWLEQLLHPRVGARTALAWLGAACRPAAVAVDRDPAALRDRRREPVRRGRRDHGAARGSRARDAALRRAGGAAHPGRGEAAPRRLRAT